MSGAPRGPVFLARETYGRRRLRDLARMLPLFGAVLILLPLLRGADPAARTGGVLIYLFVLWALLVAVAALLSRRLADESPPRDGAD
ncbi:hypothetical protein OG2516_05023 [Oceanicola granulosus HTCC2516]|uniref:Uncharacterized protein n=1 Tax=Oceanicola granulosus (strain ATCC BAA-861 / DSM 15982 / KCTC 12143 / HTCC2516) TaxID=314256 RepID=Q2CBY3_OCEGH|nr:hypothetical protein [Oceanicola granulosus]EAR50211.1 hypothetical protein OG2516_05023 [Oceanicola granulosus HTCC2516]